MEYTLEHQIPSMKEIGSGQMVQASATPTGAGMVLTTMEEMKTV